MSKMSILLYVYRIKNKSNNNSIEVYRKKNRIGFSGGKNWGVTSSPNLNTLNTKKGKFLKRDVIIVLVSHL
jgi:hypothetical protein